jgi:putative phosphoribosyl transferase
MFANRVDAGVRLAAALRGRVEADDTIVLGIPRGGVIVAAEVARELDLPLDVAIAAKVGAPGNPEYAIGAVAADGEVTANPSAGYSAAEVRKHSGAALAKVHDQLKRLRGERGPLRLAGRTVVLVDDGLATGLTATAAAEWLRREGAGRVIVAVPVAPPETVRVMGAHADEVVAVEEPQWFSAVGQFYREFGQTEDAEVIAALEAAPKQDG